MVILINTRFLLKDYLEGYGNFVLETTTRICTAHPDHQFILLFDRPVDPEFSFPNNATTVVRGPQARHPLLWWFWYNFSLPAIAKKYKVDVILSPDGFCSLTTRIPQCIVVHDLAFLHYPKFNEKSHRRFYRRFTPKFLKKAKVICTVSEYSKADIIKHYKIDKDKIDVIYSGTGDDFIPVNLDIREETKIKYAAGMEYFLFTGAIHPRKNLLNLLKAFSKFKKRQKSSMKLVITGRLGWRFNEFAQKLKSYKYRDDVVLTGYLKRSELVHVTASAYAMVYPSLFEGFGVPPLESMRAEVPVIVSNTSALPEITGDAALLADPADPSDIADKMMMLFKDENFRLDLIKKGIEQSKKYSWDNTADLLWQSIIKAIGK